MVELIWDGKYTPEGKKSAPVRLALPFQDVETVNESAQQRQLMLDMFGRGTAGEWRNRLIWGDKKYVLPSLLPEFAGKVNLVYIDPPFATGADFSYLATVADDPDTSGDQSLSFPKQPSMVEQKAYRDTWGRGLDSYLRWFYETIVLLRELLADDGSIYVHLDTHMSHYAKGVLDEVLGTDRFRSEIIWKRTSAHSSANRYGPVHDVVLFYTVSDKFTWHEARAEYEQEYLDKYYRFDDGDGRLYWRADLCAAGVRRGSSGMPWRGFDPAKKGMHWKFTIERLEELDAEGRIYWPKGGTGMPQFKRYREDLKGKALSDIWDDIDRINPVGSERLGYPTQKPEALLERILRVSSTEGDIILDSFCGSGTTAAVAEKLGRRWITADLGRFAIHTTRKRLLSIPDVRPFVVQNLGKYERQAWQVAEFGHTKEKAALAQARYRRFILDLYGAEPLDGYTWLHGLKAGRMVHIGSVDAPVLLGDIKAIAQEFWRAVGKDSGAATNSVDVLGWDFAFELNEMGKQMAADANIKMSFKRIPREVLEKKAVEQGDIKFFELAALSTEVKVGAARTVSVELCDFIVPPDDVPEEVQRAITHWSQFIDYWAIDWDYKGDTFHNQWQNYRTKKQGKLQLAATSTYAVRGTYTIVIKVIDILGNDTTKGIEVEVA